MNYLYDGPNLLEQVENSGNVLARYSGGPWTDETLSQLQSGSSSYYEQDGLGSVTSLSNPAGALANTYTYDSFGKVTASTGTLTNPFQFTGREFDAETGLRYYRFRYFDPTIGRFISEDPIGFDGGINFYRYVQNNPSLLIDPFVPVGPLFWILRPNGSYLKVTVPPAPGRITCVNRFSRSQLYCVPSDFVFMFPLSSYV